MNNGRIIFVGGLPRSGTTLLQNILDSHPDIFGGPEFDRIPNIVDLRRKLISSVKSTRIDFYLDKEKIDFSIAKFVEDLLLATAEKFGKKFISEKTPWNILAFPDLLEIFPNSKFIHVVRDPRSVLKSMMRVAQKAKDKKIIPPDYTTNIELAIFYFESVYKVASLCENIAPDRFISVRYEDIIQSVETESKRISAFLEIPWNKAMMYPGEKEHPGNVQMTQNEIWYNKSSFQRNLDKSSLNNWSDVISPLILAFMTNVLNKNRDFLKFGYKLDLYPSLGIIDKFLLKRMLKRYKFFNSNHIPLRILP